MKTIASQVQEGFYPPLTVPQQLGRLAIEPAEGQRPAAVLLQPFKRLLESAGLCPVGSYVFHALPPTQPKPKFEDELPTVAGLGADKPLPP
jgi:hypothetical protein